MGFVVSHKRQVFTFAVSVVLSILLVASISFGTTYVDTDSVGIATATPGAALGAKGEAIVEGFLSVDYIFSTSTSHASGFGTSSPGADFAAVGGALFEGQVVAGRFEATSTTDSVFEGALDIRENATSTFVGGMDFGTTSLIVDNNSGRIAIGTSSVTDSDHVATTLSVDPALTISGLGSANNATGTLYIAGEGANGGQIILKGSNGLGSRCVSIAAATGAIDVGGSGSSADTQLIIKVVSCPE